MSKSFGFFLVPGFSLVALSCAIDVLRAANVELKNQSFAWHLIGSQGSEVASSSGLALPAVLFSDVEDCDVIAIVGGERSHLFHDAAATNWFKRQAALGKTIGSISDAAFVAAEAGLFDRCRSTIHWKCQTAYREQFPHLDVRTSIMEIEGSRFSCAGGTASLDLMLRFVLEISGAKIVGEIADNYFHDVIRGDDQVQLMTSAFRYAQRDPILSDALLLMEANLETPLSIGEISDQLNTSPRQLDRIFRRHLNTSPSNYYRDLRLIRAGGLLKQSRLSVAEIAVSCGFQSSSHMAKFFKIKFGKTPLSHRKSL